MKQIKTLIRNLFVFALLAILAISCNNEKAGVPQDPNEFILQTNAEEYQRLLSARQVYEGTTFEIKDLQRDGNLLKITVEGPGTPSNYKIVWNGILLESYPAMTNLVVAYQPSENPQHAAILTHVLTVDLKELFGPSVDPKDVTVTISNGSKPIDTIIDPNGSVSNK